MKVMKSKNIILKIAKWQSGICLWLIIGFCSLFLLLLSHIFQSYFFMPPCEQCVYIRFAFVLLIFSSLIAIFLKQRLISYIISFYAIYFGFRAAIKLEAIKQAINSNNIFGMIGCSSEPNFPLFLPLDKYFPQLFKPLGSCGYDAPIIPQNTNLNTFQEYFTNLYSNGWYLIPQAKFLNMAEACIIAFGVIFLCISVMFICALSKKYLKMSD